MFNTLITALFVVCLPLLWYLAGRYLDTRRELERHQAIIRDQADTLTRQQGAMQEGEPPRVVKVILPGRVPIHFVNVRGTIMRFHCN